MGKSTKWSVQEVVSIGSARANEKRRVNQLRRALAASYRRRARAQEAQDQMAFWVEGQVELVDEVRTGRSGVVR